MNYVYQNNMMPHLSDEQKSQSVHYCMCLILNIQNN